MKVFRWKAAVGFVALMFVTYPIGGSFFELYAQDKKTTVNCGSVGGLIQVVLKKITNDGAELRITVPELSDEDIRAGRQRVVAYRITDSDGNRVGEDRSYTPGMTINVPKGHHVWGVTSRADGRRQVSLAGVSRDGTHLENSQPVATLGNYFNRAGTEALELPSVATTTVTPQRSTDSANLHMNTNTGSFTVPPPALDPATSKGVVEAAAASSGTTTALPAGITANQRYVDENFNMYWYNEDGTKERSPVHSAIGGYGTDAPIMLPLKEAMEAGALRGTPQTRGSGYHHKVIMYRGKRAWFVDKNGNLYRQGKGGEKDRLYFRPGSVEAAATAPQATTASAAPQVTTRVSGSGDYSRHVKYADGTVEVTEFKPDGTYTTTTTSPDGTTKTKTGKGTPASTAVAPGTSPPPPAASDAAIPDPGNFTVPPPPLDPSLRPQRSTSTTTDTSEGKSTVTVTPGSSTPVTVTPPIWQTLLYDSEQDWIKAGSPKTRADVDTGPPLDGGTGIPIWIGLGYETEQEWKKAGSPISRFSTGTVNNQSSSGGIEATGAGGFNLGSNRYISLANAAWRFFTGEFIEICQSTFYAGLDEEERQRCAATLDTPTLDLGE